MEERYYLMIQDERGPSCWRLCSLGSAKFYGALPVFFFSSVFIVGSNTQKLEEEERLSLVLLSSGLLFSSYRVDVLLATLFCWYSRSSLAKVEMVVREERNHCPSVVLLLLGGTFHC